MFPQLLRNRGKHMFRFSHVVFREAAVQRQLKMSLLPILDLGLVGLTSLDILFPVAAFPVAMPARRPTSHGRSHESGVCLQPTDTPGQEQ